MSDNGQGSLRDKILSMADITSEMVSVPEWGVTVEVRAMSGLERAHAMEVWSDGGGGVDQQKLYPALIIASVYDPDTGDPVFKESDAAVLNSKSAAALDRLAKVAIRLSGMTETAEAMAGEGSSETVS